ncbi:hypothetical protein OIO90_005191 [Microbotryomycetes sp. JL221]|nr:hypothetical protein OIO90_005191 [Microbotryomycetes sp. JL221]
MVALKVALPHLSLSRNNSPSRSNSTPLPTPTSKQSSPLGTRASSEESLKATVMSPVIVDEPAQMEEQPTKIEPTTTTTRSGRPGFGAFGAALRRSASGKVPTLGLGPSTPATPSMTAATTKGATLTRPTSDSATSGLIPLRTQSLKPKSRSQSTDRRALPATAVPAHALGSLQQSASQPPLSRTKVNGGAASGTTGTNGGKRSPPTSSSGAATPALAGTRAPALHNLEESYVGKVSLKLGEAVNKIFLPGGPTDLAFKGRPAPKVSKTIDFADMISHELQLALHDTYLLRTLLRSSVSKSLSLFLTRLTTLLLPTEAMGPPPMSAKEAELLSPALKFNLQVVQCAYQVKAALLRTSQAPSPGFVGDALKPWADKLGEIMLRVMNPLIMSIRISVSLICGKARLGDAGDASPAGLSTTSTNGGGLPLPSTRDTGSHLGLHKHTGVRALPSISRPSTPQAQAQQGPTWLRELTGVLEGTARMISKLECGKDADKWLVSVGTHAVWKGMLSLAARKIPDGDDATVGGANLTSSTSFSSSSTAATSSTVSKSGLFKSTKRNGSPPGGGSPPLHADHLPLSTTSSTSPAVIAFVRLIGELELLEQRLQTFMLALTSQPQVDPSTLHVGCVDVTKCGLCKTGRQFDAESSDDEQDEQEIAQAGGLAQYAMREAMQALSAMIVVVRASRQVDVLREALLLDGFASDGSQVVETIAGNQGQDQATDATDLTPLTPMALINGIGANVMDNKSTSATQSQSTEPRPSGIVVCPTLARALAEVPVLILLHLLASRLPSTISFKLPHELWNIDWRSYEKELRTFQAGEEWTPEVGWEMASQINAILESNNDKTESKVRLPEHDLARIECLKIAIEKQAGVDVAAVGSGVQKVGA